MATIILAVVLGLGALNGLRRGVIKEGTALIGVLLGALLANGWASEWGRQLAAGSDSPATATFTTKLLTLSLLVGTALLSGYGSGVLLPRRYDRLTMPQRSGGAVLGFVNMGLLSGFTLLFIQRLWFAASPATSPATPQPGAGTAATGGTVAAPVVSWIMQNPATRFLVERLGLFLLGVAATFALLSLVIGLLRLVRRPAVAAAPKPTTGTASTATPKPTTATAASGAAAKPSPASPPSAATATTASAAPKPATPKNNEFDMLKEELGDVVGRHAPGASPSFIDPKK